MVVIWYRQRPAGEGRSPPACGSLRWAECAGKEVPPAAQHEDLREALSQLPQKLRTAVVLHYMEGYDVSELSRLLRIPRGTVTSRLHMARGRLRELLKEDIE